jgi:hypothetical protein
MCGISSLVAPSKNLFTSMKCMRRQPASLIMTCNRPLGWSKNHFLD